MLASKTNELKVVFLFSLNQMLAEQLSKAGVCFTTFYFILLSLCYHHICCFHEITIKMMWIFVDLCDLVILSL